MRLITIALSLAFAACSKPRDVVVVKLTPETGLGRIATAMFDIGPSSDPVGGRRDMSDEAVTGIPDSLTHLNVRFIDFQFPYLAAEAVRAGRIDSAEYNRYRDPTIQVSLPGEPFDGHVHYAVGRRSNGDFEVVFDTDNDEDLSDEEALIYPWIGEAMDIREFFSRRVVPAELESYPKAAVAVELTDGEKVYRDTVSLRIIPHLKVSLPGGSGGEIVEKPAYMIGVDGNMVGLADVGGHEFTFWVGSSRGLAVYTPRDAQIWFEEGRSKEVHSDTAFPYVDNPYLIGQVVDLGGSYYRLDDISIDGSELRLAPVESMPGVGIRPGMEAPEFSSVTIDGDALDLSDYRGKYVLLDFWSTSCGPCVEALPELRQLYERFPREEFEIVGIAEDDRSWLSQFVADNDIRWPQVTQNRFDEGRGAILKDYRVTGIPAYFLIDPEGKIARAGWEASLSVLADSLHSACISTIDSCMRAFSASSFRTLS